jgi:hypothetical protein
VEQGQNAATPGQFIYLSRNSKLARLFQEAAVQVQTQPTPQPPPPAPSSTIAVQTRPAAHRPSASACPKLQAVANPSLELTRPLAAALMREQAGLRCAARGVLLDNEYVRDICAAGAHQHCPFLRG